LSKQGIVKDIQELDFRSGDVVYRLNTRAAGAARAPGSDTAVAPRVDAASARNTDAVNARGTDAAMKGG
jgi:hypothetical protein